MNEILNTNKELIYEVRGKKVILDRDLAKLLNMETKVLNQTIKRNIDMFSNDDYFKINSEDFSNLRSQIVTSSWGGSRTLPYALTGNGLKIFFDIYKTKKKANDIFKILDLFEISEETNVTFIPSKDIEKHIYVVRGKQVMMDYDLAKYYECSNGTKSINLAVKRHPNRLLFSASRRRI